VREGTKQSRCVVTSRQDCMYLRRRGQALRLGRQVGPQCGRALPLRLPRSCAVVLREKKTLGTSEGSWLDSDVVGTNPRLVQALAMQVRVLGLVRDGRLPRRPWSFYRLRGEGHFTTPPHRHAGAAQAPRRRRRCSMNSCLSRGLVKLSANCSFVGQYTNLMFLAAT